MSDPAGQLARWRSAVAAYLDEHLQEGAFTVLSGYRDGMSKDRKVACVFTTGGRPWEEDVFFWRPVLIVRAWLPKTPLPRATELRDPTPLEELAVDLPATLEGVRTSLLEDLYFQLGAIEIDHEDWGVQMTLVAFAPNPGE